MSLLKLIKSMRKFFKDSATRELVRARKGYTYYDPYVRELVSIESEIVSKSTKKKKEVDL